MMMLKGICLRRVGGGWGTPGQVEVCEKVMRPYQNELYTQNERKSRQSQRLQDREEKANQLFETRLYKDLLRGLKLVWTGLQGGLSMIGCHRAWWHDFWGRFPAENKLQLARLALGP